MALENTILSASETIQRLQSNALDHDQLKAILLSLTPERLNDDILQAWLTALFETAPEIPDLPSNILDCCGTGGSGLPHFNTSTIVAFVLAASGVKVIKFGNRGIQQPHGSFDFLASLGFDRPAPIEKIPFLLEQAGLSFLFAPQCYPYLAPLHQVRKTLTSPTLFHYIGPLLNPALPAFRLLGMSNRALLPLLENALCKHPLLSSRTSNALVVHTRLDETLIGLDECAPLGSLHISGIKQQKRYDIQIPANSSIADPKAQLKTLLNGLTVEDSVAIFQNILNGELPDTSCQQWLSQPISTVNEKQRYAFCIELVLQNAALGLIAAEKAHSFEAGMDIARNLVQDKKVLETFKQYQKAYDACHS